MHLQADSSLIINETGAVAVYIGDDWKWGCPVVMAHSGAFVFNIGMLHREGLDFLSPCFGACSLITL